jgi:hypothetical protein
MVHCECFGLEGVPGAGFATIRLGRRRNIAVRIAGLCRRRSAIDWVASTPQQPSTGVPTKPTKIKATLQPSPGAGVLPTMEARVLPSTGGGVLRTPEKPQRTVRHPAPKTERRRCRDLTISWW